MSAAKKGRRVPPPLPTERNTFHVAFDIDSMPGYAVVTTVVLARQVVRGDKFDDAVFCIALVDHPEYAKLAQYVTDNPVRPA